MNAHSNDRQSNLISNSVASPKFNLSRVVSWLVNGCNDYVYHLVYGHRPHVWQQRDRFGTLQWCAHDSMTGRSIQCVSEDEVRVWLESVLYR